MCDDTELGYLQERCRWFRLADDGGVDDLVMRVKEHLLLKRILEGCAVRCRILGRAQPTDISPTFAAQLVDRRGRATSWDARHASGGWSTEAESDGHPRVRCDRQ